MLFNSSLPGAVGSYATGRLQDWFTGLHDSIVSSFLPRKQDVTDDYWEWLKWRLGQVGAGREQHSSTSHSSRQLLFYGLAWASWNILQN